MTLQGTPALSVTVAMPGLQVLSPFLKYVVVCLDAYVKGCPCYRVVVGCDEWLDPSVQVW